MANKVFISYSHQDGVVKLIYDYLKRKKCNLFLDEKSIAPGAPFPTEIEDNIIDSSCLICFVSKNYLNSDYCKKELQIAFEKSIPVIPFIIENELSANDISNLLGTTNATHLFGMSESEQIDYVYRFLLSEYPSSFDNKENLIFSNSDRKILIDVRNEVNQSGDFDQIAEIMAVSLNSSTRLFAFDTPTGLAIEITKHDSQTLNDVYFSNENDPIFFSALFEITRKSDNNKLISFVAYFVITNPSSKFLEAKIVDVKIISPLTNKYERGESIEELMAKVSANNELVELLKIIKEKLIDKIETSGGDHNCLEKKNKKTELLTISQIFMNPNCFRIPDYQRGYAWRAFNKKQLKAEFKELWEDILRVFYSGSDYQSHYTGMLALQEMSPAQKAKEHLSTLNAFDVVDGQQRLTSIVIILESIRWYLIKCGIVEQSMFAIDESLGIYRFDYSEDRGPYESRFFCEYIYNNRFPAIVQMDAYLRDIQDAKVFMDEELKKFSESQVLAIKDVILNKLIFNIYFVSKEFDVRVTFETMNNRGKKLSNLELLKNRLMYLTSFVKGYEDPLKQLISQRWKEIYDNVSFDEENERDDEYLQAHWNIYKPFVKGRSERYKEELLEEEFSLDNGEFYPYIKNGDYVRAKDHIVKYVESLAKYSTSWRIIHNPLDSSNRQPDTEKKALDKLNRIVSMQYVKPTVMAVCGEDDMAVTSSKKVEFYEALEIALFIVRVMGLNSDNTFSDVCTKAHFLLEPGNKLQKMDDLIAACRNIEDCYNVNRIKEAIRKLGDNLNKYSKREQLFYKWPGIEYVLYEYEADLSLRTTYNVTEQLKWNMIDKKSIEHILPQDPSNGYWQISLRNINDPSGNEIKRLQNSIGNLLLLSNKENSAVKNYSFKTKKDSSVNSRHYSYRFGTRAAQKVAEKDVWTPYEIHEREKELFTFIFNNWINKTGCGLTLNDFLLEMHNANLDTPDYPELTPRYKNQLIRFDNSNERVANVQVVTQSSARVEFEEKIKPYFLLKSAELKWPDNKPIGKYYFRIDPDWIWVHVSISQNDFYQFVYERPTHEIKIYHGKIRISDLNLVTAPEAVFFIDTFNRLLRLEYSKTQKMIPYEASKMDYSFISRKTIINANAFHDKVITTSPAITALYDSLMGLINTRLTNVNCYFTNDLVAFKVNAKNKKVFAELVVSTDKISVHISKMPTNSYGFDIKDVARFKLFYIDSHSDLQNVCNIIEEISRI